MNFEGRKIHCSQSAWKYTMHFKGYCTALASMELQRITQQPKPDPVLSSGQFL